MNWKEIVDELKVKEKAYQATGNNQIATFLKAAAEELDCAVNELCLHCGQYLTRHLGSCDGCRWKEET
jgi:hypothetical protein